MPNVIISPASNSPYPPCTVSIQGGEGELVGGMRKRVADRYYVERSQVFMIYKGRVLYDEMTLGEVGLKENARVNVSIDCPTRQPKKQEKKVGREEEMDDWPFPTPVSQPKGTKAPQAPSAVSKSPISSQPSLPVHAQSRYPSQIPPLHANQDEQAGQEATLGAISKLMLGRGYSSRSSVFKSVLSKMMGQFYDIPPPDQLKQKFGGQLAQLREMGVCTTENQDLCLRELHFSEGDVSAAVYYITRDV